LQSSMGFACASDAASGKLKMPATSRRLSGMQASPQCRARAGGHPVTSALGIAKTSVYWIPAFAGMTALEGHRSVPHALEPVDA
jgi:hypothetical protein